MFASILTDNHPPLYLFLLWSSVKLLGEGHLGLRLPAMLAGLGCLAVVWSICRRLPDRAARALGGWLLLGSSFLLLVSTEARMYSFLALSVAGLLWGILRVTEGRASSLEPAFWTAVGLHTHYYFVIYLTVAGLAVVGLRMSRWASWRIVVSILAGMAAGCVLFLPWFFWGFVAQYRHKVWAGPSARGLGEWIQSIAHLLYIDVGRLGQAFLWGVVLPGCLAALALGAVGIRRLWTADAGRPEGRRGLRILLLFCLTLAVAAPIAAKLLNVALWRISYCFRYVAGSCAPLVILVAAGLRDGGRTSRVLGGIVFCTMFATTLLNSVSPGREDYRGAVRHIMEHALAGDVVLIPPGYYAEPDAAPTGWDYYAERLAASSGRTPPLAIRTTHWEDALSHDRVWLLVRGQVRPEVIDRLRHDFGREGVTKISHSMAVRLFERL